MSKANIEKMMGSLAITEAAMRGEMERLYPVGTKVYYKRRGGSDAHKYPAQIGTIVGHKGGMDARFHITLAPSRGDPQGKRPYTTTLPFKKIIGLAQ